MAVKTIQKSMARKLATWSDLKKDDQRSVKRESASMPMLHDSCHKSIADFADVTIATKNNEDQMIGSSMDSSREEIKENFLIL